MRIKSLFSYRFPIKQKPKRSAAFTRLLDQMGELSSSGRFILQERLSSGTVITHHNCQDRSEFTRDELIDYVSEVYLESHPPQFEVKEITNRIYFQ